VDNTMFQINVLPAGVGDCIHLRFFSKGKWYNIVIDSGPKQYAEQFLNLLLRIGKNEEQVDLLCFTHIDDDHIQAAEAVFGSNKDIGKIIKKIWINIPAFEKERTEPLEPRVPEKISVKNALKLYRYIRWFEMNSQLVCETRIQAGDSIDFGDVEVNVVLPYTDRLEKLDAWWKKSDPHEKTHEKISAVSPDRSETNGSSIVLRIDAHGQKMLFAGDAFAVDLYTMAKAQSVDFDLVKLPHHGSRSNITLEMLEMMGCRRFIVSADGSRGRPARDAITLLGTYGEIKGDVTLYSNYDLSVIRNVDHLNPVPLKKKPDLSAGGISIRTEAIRQ